MEAEAVLEGDEDDPELVDVRIGPVETQRAGSNVGDQAPAFTLKTIGLKEVSLADYKGKNVVLLFYPLDWTPG